MSLDAESFLVLCAKLRAMGAAQVEGYGFKAVFPLPAGTPRAVVIPPEQREPPPAQAKRRAKKALLERATDEQLREEVFAKELGL